MLALAGASPVRHPSHPVAGCSRRRPEMTSRTGFCPYFQGRMERPRPPLRSSPRVAGAQLGPKRHPSNRDALAPICRLRRLARETWMPRESAPPANPDTAQSAPPTAATARESVACRAAPPRLAPELARPGLARLDRPTASEARPRTTEPTTTGKPNAACPIEALRTLRHVRKCSCSCTSSAKSYGTRRLDQQEAESLRCRPATLAPFVRTWCEPVRSFDDPHQPFRQFALHHVFIH